ncbi:multicopper oxidase family protein [Kribbella shirazensis]|uniref:FtsP/CotA-like multicopper oxidase with cupredoxin domain n=1 Tax=Kribbella shirazensis TaxID=1105143 RepID=A0A7X5V7P4_9ACTN|nr:multicopper oxidase family protein [Kribbella shirazensis]NIK56154.1 FtsP/CotA-like multicopper oxidase with cupredoxin domain [Kribbella shirazensis]
MPSATTLAGRRRLAVALVAAVAVLAPLGFFWQGSLVPGDLSPMAMGYADYGGGPASAHVHHGTEVGQLTGPAEGTPDVAVDLVAREERFDVPGRGPVDGFTLNHTSPGPRIVAEQGDLVQVTLHNENVADGITLHWHGVDVPNAEDGVAGVTQDAVAPGKSHVYRFVAEDAGTYWYHSHQASHEQVQKGLYGVLVVKPTASDVIAAVHTYDKIRTVNGEYGERRVKAPGPTARVRLINTDNGPMAAWVDGAPYKVLAVDGTDVNGPTEVRGKAVLVTAGGRIDLEVPTTTAVRIGLGGGPTTLVIGDGDAPAGAEPRERVDLLTYGSPKPLGLDPASADRVFRYDIGRRIGFFDGKPGMWWTINGHQYPNVPMFVVSEGDVVRMRIRNTSGQVHPMHLHGHHVVVLSRDGVKATGSPWWTDSLNVEDKETYEVAFVADNPGIWMDHCHNLPHAAQGLVTHLMYTGVTTKLHLGGAAGNQPE